MATTDLSTTPGALQDHKVRELDDGSRIEFEFAPAGWLTRRGDVRQQDYRAYYLRPAAETCEPCEGTGRRYERSQKGRKCELCAGTGNRSRRGRLPSVSTIVGAIVDKPGIPPWSEARGIEGTIAAIRAGKLDPYDETIDPVKVVRGLRLGADARRDASADRGLNVHACLEHYLRTRKPPNPVDHPPEHRGYLRGLTRWLLMRRPVPVAIEDLVCSPSLGYAGRLDLRAVVKDPLGGELLYTFDAKTQENGYIYEGAHAQVNLYERAAVESGARPADRLAVVVFAADGRYREDAADHEPELVTDALAWYQRRKPIAAHCEANNRIQREARKAVAA